MRALLFLLISLLPACASTMNAPTGFVRHDEAAEYRASSSDRGKLWLRDFSDPDGADLAFCADAMRHDLVEQRGYELIGGGEVKDAEASPGRWLEFQIGIGGEKHGYLLAVWVRPRGWPWRDRVQTCEFLAPMPAFTACREAVMQALATLKW